MSKHDVQVVVTGAAWMGAGIGSIETALERLFREAENELLLTVYSISNGADLLLDWLSVSLMHGVEVRMIVNRLDEQHSGAVSRLRELLRNYAHFQLYDCVPGDAVDMHAKVVIADRKQAVIGSSNLSRRGLLTNYELAVLVHGEAASSSARVLDRLFADPHVTRIWP